MINWDGGDLTIACIRSLKASTCPPQRIVVVDNGSKDDSPRQIKEAFPDICLIRNKKNTGFAAGCNTGIRRLLMDPVIDYVMLLNNDTEVEPDCLEILTRSMEAHADVAAATGKILRHGDRRIIWYAGGKVDRRFLRSLHIGIDEYDVGIYDRTRPVEFISGCCMLIRKDVLRQIGGFDEAFFAYAEDFDWCLRAQKAGLKMLYVHNAKLYHKISASINKHKGKTSGGTTSPFHIYLGQRNQIFIFRKHSRNNVQRAIAMFYNGLWTFFYCCALFALLRLDKLSALLRGTKDGVFNTIENQSTFY